MVFLTKIYDYQKKKYDTNKNMIKLGVIIRRNYCITKLIVDAWKNFNH
jgi:hypothetical protein